jgi:hypothetical protein
MGINYYFYSKPPCPHCGLLGDKVHIGKSSYGWCFSLHVAHQPPHYDEENLPFDWDGWKELIKSGYVQDEDGAPVTAEDMINIVECRTGSKIVWSDDMYAMNSAVPGPANLARHALGRHCVGHGTGTWDYIVGTFS